MSTVVFVSDGYIKSHLLADVSGVVSALRKRDKRALVYYQDSSLKAGSAISLPKLLREIQAISNCLIIMYTGYDETIKYLFNTAKCRVILRIHSMTKSLSIYDGNVTIDRTFNHFVDRLNSFHSLTLTTTNYWIKDRLESRFPELNCVWIMPYSNYERLEASNVDMTILSKNITFSHRSCILTGVVWRDYVTALKEVSTLLSLSHNSLYFYILITDEELSSPNYREFLIILHELRLENYIELVLNHEDKELLAYYFSSYVFIDFSPKEVPSIYLYYAIHFGIPVVCYSSYYFGDNLYKLNFGYSFELAKTVNYIIENPDSVQLFRNESENLKIKSSRESLDSELNILFDRLYEE